MYEQELKFRHFVASRSSDPIEQWKETLACPVVCVNGLDDYRETAVNIARLYDKLPFELKYNKQKYK